MLGELDLAGSTHRQEIRVGVTIFTTMENANMNRLFVCAIWLLVAPLAADEGVVFVTSPFASADRASQFLDAVDLRIMLPMLRPATDFSLDAHFLSGIQASIRVSPKTISHNHFFTLHLACAV